MKECPECSMFNAPNEVKCKWCGAHLGNGTSGDSDSPASSRREADPRVKEEQEKEARKKKIVTWVGYGVLGAALVGYLIYMQVKKSKEEKSPPETPAAETDGGKGGEEALPGKDVSSLKQTEKAASLGDRVRLEAAGLSFSGFADAVIESQAPGASPSPFAYRARSKDGSIILTVRTAENAGGATAPTPDAQARLMADWIVGHGKPIAVPGKGEGNSKAGIPWFMLEADHGDRLERVYWVYTDRSRVEISIDYPASGDGIVTSEKLADAIIASMEVLIAGTTPMAPAQPAAAVPEVNAKAAVPSKTPAKVPADPAAKAPVKPAAPAVKTAPASSTAGE